MNERGHDELMSDVDIAVVGSGIAGLFLANRCAEEGLNVALVTKKYLDFKHKLGSRRYCRGTRSERQNCNRGSCTRYPRIGCRTL